MDTEERAEWRQVWAFRIGGSVFVIALILIYAMGFLSRIPAWLLIVSVILGAIIHIPFLLGGVYANKEKAKSVEQLMLAIAFPFFAIVVISAVLLAGMKP